MVNTSYSLPVPFSSIGSPVPRSACEFKSSDDGGVDGQMSAENLEHSHDMAGHVFDIEILCHDVFAVRSRDLVGNMLLLLDERMLADKATANGSARAGMALTGSYTHS
jgi:hypothetical protein